MKPPFDLVAPIAIYHGANVCYKPQARRAIKLLCIEWINRFPQATAANYCDYLEYAEPENLPNILDEYRKFLREIVENERPDWKRFVDRYGAYGYKDEAGQVVLSGDSNGELPWFETQALLLERINLHSTMGANC